MYTRSADKSFLLVNRQVVINSGASEKYVIDLKDLPVESGEYEMEFFKNKPVLTGKLTIK